jgi:hypothetical protein
MQQHVKVLAWLYIIYSVVIVLIGLIVLVILGGAGAVSGDREAMFITSAVGISIAAFLLLLSIPGIIAGIGLLKYRSWARIMALVLGALHLFSFPLGTALGIYRFWVLLNEQTKPLFLERDLT